MVYAEKDSFKQMNNTGFDNDMENQVNIRFITQEKPRSETHSITVLKCQQAFSLFILIVFLPSIKYFNVHHTLFI